METVSWFEDARMSLEERIEKTKMLGVRIYTIDVDKVAQARALRSELEKELERVERWRVLCDS